MNEQMNECTETYRKKQKKQPILLAYKVTNEYVKVKNTWMNTENTWRKI